MRGSITWFTVATVAAFGCSSKTTKKLPETALEIVSLTPSTVFSEGGDQAQLQTLHGCAPDQLSVTIGGQALTGVQGVSDDQYVLTVPPSPTPSTKSTVDVIVTCARPLDPNAAYSAPLGNTAKTSLVYDPALEGAPAIKAYGPSGAAVSVLSKMIVTFSRDLVSDSISAETFQLVGGTGLVDGAVVYDPLTRTAVFTPAAPLDFNTTYSCVVANGIVGAHSDHKPLQITLGSPPDPTRNKWVFTTRGADEANPWIGGDSAAAGLSTGGGYKLFTVTGQPMPIGQAALGRGPTTKNTLNAGFVPAAAASQQ